MFPGLFLSSLVLRNTPGQCAPRMARPLPPNVRRLVRGGRDRFRAEVTIDGRKRVGQLRDTVAEAEQDVIRIRASHAPATMPLTLTRAHGLLLDELRAEGAAEATIAYYRAHFSPLVGALGWGPDRQVTEVSSAAVERYAAKRLAAGVSEATVWRKDLQVLDRIFTLLIRMGVVTASPVKLARRPKRIRTGRYAVLPASRIAECCAALRASKSANRDRLAAIVELLFATGLRRSELARLRVADVEFGTHRLWIRGKTGDAFVPLGEPAERAVRVLVTGRASTDPVVGGVRYVERLFARMQEIAGEPLLSPHVLRHSCATHLIEQGVGAFECAQFMRHASPRMTWRYVHASAPVQRRIADSLGLGSADHGSRSSGCE